MEQNLSQVIERTTTYADPDLPTPEAIATMKDNYSMAGFGQVSKLCTIAQHKYPMLQKNHLVAWVKNKEHEYLTALDTELGGDVKWLNDDNDLVLDDLHVSFGRIKNLIQSQLTDRECAEEIVIQNQSLSRDFGYGQIRPTANGSIIPKIQNYVKEERQALNHSALYANYFPTIAFKENSTRVIDWHRLRITSTPLKKYKKIPPVEVLPPIIQAKKQKLFNKYRVIDVETTAVPRNTTIALTTAQKAAIRPLQDPLVVGILNHLPDTLFVLAFWNKDINIGEHILTDITNYAKLC